MKKNVYTYHMKTLGLNAHMEGWWEKDRLRNHPKVKLHKEDTSWSN